MKTYTAAELAEIIEKHHKWLLGDGGERANLSYANLSYANLSSANLSSANLSSANLSYANLSYANLRYADLSSANLSYANLSYADLRYANLSYADLSSANLSYANLRSANLRYAASLWGAIGNMSEVKSVQCDIWPVTYTATHMQIGCQFHTLTEWFEFSDEEIKRMDLQASAWWLIWKPILKTVIEASPAKPIEIAPMP